MKPEESARCHHTPSRRWGLGTRLLQSAVTVVGGIEEGGGGGGEGGGVNIVVYLSPNCVSVGCCLSEM